MLDKFEIVCPACSSTFDLEEEVICKGWDDELAEEYLKVVCPDCGCQRCIDLQDETD